MKRACCSLALTAFLGSAVAHGQVIINEVDADTVGADALEFVELYDGGVGNTDLSDLVIVLYNGSDDASYNAFDLDGFSTDGNGYFILGNEAVTGVDLIVPGNTLQNGADAVALYTGEAANFPNDTPITLENLLDAMVYDTNDSDDAGLLVLLNKGQPQLNEDENGNKDFHSNSRCPNGEGGSRNTDSYDAIIASSDAENACDVVTLGACCHVDFTCDEDVPEADCMAKGDRWAEGTACEDLDPPCAPPPGMGACCSDITGICVEDFNQEDCEALGRRYVGNDSTCDDANCKQGVEPSNVIISEIIDGTLTGGQPKSVSITNCSDAEVDLSNYSVGNFNNGGLDLGGGQSSALAGTLAPGETYAVAYEFDDNTACDPDGLVTCFEFVHEAPPDQFVGPFINGDDVLALFLGVATGDGSDAILVDVYGVIGVDGTGEVWEYTDGYSQRNPGAGAAPVFDPDQWLFGGVNSLETGNDDEELLLIRKLTTPFDHECEEGGDPCPADFDDSGAVDFNDLLQLLSKWGDCVDCPEDLDGNDVVDFQDLLVLLAAWGACP